jgi:hypothetical protein
MILRVLPVFAFFAALSGAQPKNYANPETWLCRPGVQGACAVDLTTTVIAANGKLKTEAWKADPNAPIDCFYVYPTISTDTTANSDMTPDPAERNVVRQQFARFGSKCRLYAPMYRQVTLAGLRRMLGGGGGSLDRGIQYDDVRDAWNYYLEHDNQGRGVVLVSHSQGSFILARLVKEEIDGKPVQARLVSAMLLGATLTVARGRDVGGSFEHIPVCQTATQTGCLIAYSSFRSTIPPPSNTRFGKSPGPDREAVCVNPATLAGNGELRAYLDREGRTIASTPSVAPWVSPARAITTPWVSLPGLLTARCTSNAYANYLEVTVHGNPSDPRVDDITGDLGANGQVAADWGLHLIDVNLAMGNLVELVGHQAKAWIRGQDAASK